MLETTIWLNLSINQIKDLEITPSGMWEEQNDVR